MADAAFAFAALDPHLGDSFAFMRRVPANIGGIRIGIADSWFWNDCENGIDEIVRTAIEKLARAGAAIKDKPLPEAREAHAVFSEGGVSAISCAPFSTANCRIGLTPSIRSMRRRSRIPRLFRRATI